jgi:hypothetical protein
MNITISKTSTLRVIVILMTLVLLVWGGSLALATGYPARWFANPTPLPQDSPAIQAVAAIYSADPASERSTWEDAVCSGMTAKGCPLFKTMYAPAVWAATTQKNKVAVSVLQVADTLEDGSQIWQVNISTSAAPADIYIQVAADPTSGQWLLERILFTQETAQYAQ